MKNAAGQVIDDTALAPHHFYYKCKIITDTMEIEDLTPADATSMEDAAPEQPAPTGGAAPPAAKKAQRGAGGGTTVKQLELRVASLEADRKIIQSQMKELMVMLRTKEADRVDASVQSAAA